MRLALRTPTAVVFRESGTFGYVAGTIVALAGAIIILRTLDFVGAATARILPFAVGAVLAGIGGWIVRRATATTYAFDREQRALVITRKRLGEPATSERYPLRDVADVKLEERRTSRGGAPTYRVAIQLAGGRTIPCTFYYSSGREAKVEMVNAARELLARADGVERAPVTTGEIVATSPPSPRDVRSSRTALRLITIFCSLFLAVGVWTAGLQWERLSRWVPVPATVMATSVERHGGSRNGPTYAPRVMYRYMVSGHEYVQSRVTPLSESRGGRWAWDVIARYHPGQPTTAWYDPSRPERAYLLHEWTMLPFIFIALPLAFVALARWAARRGALRSRVRARRATRATAGGALQRVGDGGREL
ncbi:MAG TPA: DUF3592 domain-containing protein [Gemmatimonadaceae bacterium]